MATGSGGQMRHGWPGPRSSLASADSRGAVASQPVRQPRSVASERFVSTGPPELVADIDVLTGPDADRLSSVGRDRLATMLLDGPDLMDIGLVLACLRARLVDVTVVAEPIVCRWFRQFALLSEPNAPAGLHRTVLVELQVGGGAP